MRKWIAVLLVLALTVCLAAAGAESAILQPIRLSAFDCEDLDGNPVDITLFDGADFVLIDVWEPWCGWCLKEMPDLNELYELNKDRGFLIVGLSGLGAADGFDPKETSEELGISYPLVNGTEDLIPTELEGYPTTFAYQRQADDTLQLVKVITGYLPREDWNALLAEYLPDAVTEAEVK